ncbi:spore coat associated protein CotJA [Clostridium septicum]|uniref:Spore coat associated protein CotJA n=1 Tax=Clostridium septicum TaxID=1504 RepID=A0A9N7JJ76_CLOSE|nr:spore coat associated protein CotJA [Clostridium septicum]AYE33005.1 spore coat associated protein CotJA [Clostridium septicum]MDU1313395.1 spore coat associated protein CotJA [Clostridium septicum]QAS61173.1 spore coat associated protein CotJA [Clostridium septicum]UEC19479.1 spore coat associated protein CotJA [Clostridium septicum]USR99568.1 spore coat associated protein CotJA [Clostridium septicum]
MNIEENLIRNNEYAKAYIILQKYENLLTPATALNIGTIFRDLYRPYIESEK